eukprot:6406056-Amphidinium_carterae.1
MLFASGESFAMRYSLEDVGVRDARRTSFVALLDEFASRIYEVARPSSLTSTLFGHAQFVTL